MKVTQMVRDCFDCSKERRENILFCLCMCFCFCVSVCFVINSCLSLWKTKQEISLEFVSFTIQAALGKKSCLGVSTSTGLVPNHENRMGTGAMARQSLERAQTHPDKRPASKRESWLGSSSQHCVRAGSLFPYVSSPCNIPSRIQLDPRGGES